MNAHPLTRILLDSLAPGSKGLEIDPGKTRLITDTLTASAKKNDPGAAQALYDFIAMLQHTSAPAAVQTLTRLSMSFTQRPPAPAPKRQGWGSRP